MGGWSLCGDDGKALEGQSGRLRGAGKARTHRREMENVKRSVQIQRLGSGGSKQAWGEEMEGGGGYCMQVVRGLVYELRRGRTEGGRGRCYKRMEGLQLIQVVEMTWRRVMGRSLMPGGGCERWHRRHQIKAVWKNLSDGAKPQRAMELCTP